MDVDPSWTFDEYQAYERARLNESLAEQRQAHANGLEVDPKSEPHGGYRIACVWSDEATSAACALSARLAELLPGTLAYPYQAIHSSIGNISAPDGRLVDPDRNQEDRALLERLAGAVEKALAAPPKAVDGCMVDFGPALLSPRMALGVAVIGVHAASVSSKASTCPALAGWANRVSVRCGPQLVTRSIPSDWEAA